MSAGPHDAWVWAALPDDVPAGRQVVALRAVVELDAVASPAVLRWAAVGRAAVFVNGTEVGRGPVRSQPRRPRHEAVDVTARLRTGRNVLGVLAWWSDRPGPDWMPDAATPHGAVRVILEGPDVAVRWSARLLPGWGSGEPVGLSGRGDEVLDRRDLPEGWCDPDADPIDDWVPAAAVTGPRIAAERGRPVPPPDGSLVEPVAQVIEVGTLVVDATVPHGTVVRVGITEDVPDTSLDARDDVRWLRVVGDGARRVSESLDVYGGRRIVVDAPDGATVHGVQLRSRRARREDTWRFECSDPRIERIAAIGRRTVDRCTLDTYVDCPTREQRAWMDAVVPQMVDLATSDDWRTARWYVELHASPRPDGMLPMAVAGDIEWEDEFIIPDWALHWVHGAHELLRHVGDRAEIARHLPVALGLLRWFEPFGLGTGCAHDVPDVLADWAAVRTDATSAVLNGLLGRALLEVHAMARFVGDAGAAAWAQRGHVALASAYEVLWDPERRSYVDTAVGGERRPMRSQHAQAAAIVGGLVPVERVADVVTTMTDEAHLVHATFDAPDGPAEPGTGGAPGAFLLQPELPDPWWDVERHVVRAQPFFRYVVHDALARAGEAGRIAPSLVDWDRWAVPRCETTWTETWQGGTTCHAWSSTPTRDVVRHVLGVEPAAPGFSTARVRPHLGHLSWARGRAATPHGWIDVEVDDDDVSVSSPVPVEHDGVTHPPGAWTAPRRR